MAAESRTQIYLQTPRQPDPNTFPAVLAELLDSVPVACLRLSTAASSPDEIRRLADIIRDIAHPRDVPLVIESHFRMVLPLGLDGVHLVEGIKHIREARKLLGADGVVGAFCAASRHAGMTAAEMTADYVSFGPMVPDPLLGDGTAAEMDLFRWWSDMIEVPVVAEGGLSLEMAEKLAECADFISLGTEIWNASTSPQNALKQFALRLR